MAIELRETGDPGLFPCKRWVQWRTADDEHVITISGIAILLPLVKGTGPDWKREEVTIWIRFPGEIPPGMSLRILEWASFIAPTAIVNEGQAVNAGWAVDEFWGPPGPPLGQSRIQSRGVLGLFTRMAVRDIDGAILRLAYQVTLKGRYEPV